ncbi:MAG: ferritin-like domain-containing protein [Gordonia sp. (in: high G+C Gram-positive bacteria)]|uniref:ferritin-like domain-containing protein n=1 Tax=Gordonia sp. (in: high G+C Gram-positive bacteria) TaxID=84139 RepID=UPI0039E21A76
MTVNDSLAAAVRAEDAAIFTYGVLTAFTRYDVRSRVADDIAAHRVRRRDVAEALTAGGGQVPTRAPGYRLPDKVSDLKSAGRAAVDAETETQIAYRALVEQADTDQLRTMAVEALTESAVRAVYWRGIAGISPAAIAVPGDPREK